jgi:phosphoglycerate dehydrogenase-like enzyme
MPAGLFALGPAFLPSLFPPPVLSSLQELVRIDPELTLTAQDFDDRAVRESLAHAEVLVTGWGCPRLDEAVLDAAPRLRAVLHSGGSVRSIVTDACWERGVQVSTAAAANAVPVAEYTLAAILFSGKDAFGFRERYRAEPSRPRPWSGTELGNSGRHVGIVGASRVGRHVLELLRPFDFTVLLHDPYVTPDAARALGAEPCELDELLERSDVVSLHAPALPETRHLLDRRRLGLIRDGGVLVNTARGSLVDHTALMDELVTGRLNAVLDVTDPEPVPAGSPLLHLPNVFLTPHVSGSAGNEMRRLGQAVVEEAGRYVQGAELTHQVRREDLPRMA